MTHDALPVSPEDRALALAAGYRVSEDPDQPGWWLWTHVEDGKTVGGCDSSLDSEDAIWAEVVGMVVDVVREELRISLGDWDAMDQDARMAAMQQAYFGD